MYSTGLNYYPEFSKNFVDNKECTLINIIVSVLSAFSRGKDLQLLLKITPRLENRILLPCIRKKPLLLNTSFSYTVLCQH